MLTPTIDPYAQVQQRLKSLGNYAKNPFGAAHMTNSLRKQQQSTDNLELDPAVEESIARKAGRVALGGIGAAANLLGLPGSMALDTITGHNPFDQLATPFSPENRTTGRDAGRQWGWMDKEDTWGNFFGGLGIDVLTDPLTYVNPFGALTKGGQVVKDAGMLGKVEALASTKAAQAAKDAHKTIELLGPRTAQLKTKVADLIASASPEEMLSLETAAKGAGLNLQDLAKQPLRGALGLGFMGKTLKTVGTGPVGEKYVAGMDRLGAALRYGKIPFTNFSPVNQLAKLFHAPLGTTEGRLGQMYAKKSFWEKEVGRSDIGLQVADHVSKLAKHGFATEKQATLLRAAFEEIQPGTYFHKLPPEVQQVVTELDSSLNGIYDQVVAEGGKIDKWESPLAKYWPRQGLADEMADVKPGGAASAPTGSLDARNRFAQSRNPILQPLRDADGNVTDAIVGETNTLHKLIKDKRLHAKIEAYESDEDIAKWMREHYGDKIPNKFNDVDGRVKDRFPALAGWISNMTPEQRRLGFFANNPVMDYQSYAITGVGTAAALRNIREMLVFPGTIFRPGEAAAQRGWNTMRQAFGGVEGHLDAQAYGKRVMDDYLPTLKPEELMDFNLGAARQARKGNVADLVEDDLVNHFLDHRISEENAADIGRIAKGFSSPEPARKIFKFLDSVTNLWKGHQTGEWPAYHVRNLGSGQTNNYLSGMWDSTSFFGALKVVRGGEIKDAINYPIVQQIARERGLVNLTNRQATDILGEVAYAQNTTARSAGETMQAAGLEGIATPQRIEDVASEIPKVGFKGTSFKRAGRKFVGAEPGTTYNPFAMQGVQDLAGNVRTKTTFGPGAAGAEINPFVEGMNRIQPLLYLLKRGVNPAEAARRIGRAQAMYDARFFTPFERDVMQRFVPFFKFCVPTTHEILTRRGWKKYDQITVGEEVLTLNHETGTHQWEPLLNVHVFDHDGPLIQYEQSRKHKKIRFLFTEGHRWPVVFPACVLANGRHQREYRKMRLGGELKWGDRFVRTGDFQGKDTILSPRHAALLGWIVTDGYIRNRPHHRKHRSVKRYWEARIYQSPKKYLQELIELTGSVPCKPHPETGVVALNVKAIDLAVITEHFHSRADLPYIVCHLSREAAEAMYDAMLKAEGTVYDTGRIMFYQYSKNEVLEAFQILCQLTGKSANYSQQGCTVARPKFYGPVRPMLSTVHYAGQVWCPETPSGTWVMRHDGNVVITGNSKQMPIWMATELTTKPSGRLAQLLRTANRARNPDEMTPDYVAETAAVPLGESPDGSKRYLTGAGLMAEDPLSFLGSGLRGGLLEAGSRLNPLVKAPLEWGTGQSFFQKGPMGGRQLTDMDPTIGRTLANLTGQKDAVKWPGSEGMEFLLGNSPLSRAASAVRTMTGPLRTLTDPMMRGQLGTETLKTAANLGTGFRITNVSPAAQEGILRERVQTLMRAAGGKTFTRAFIPKEDLAKMSPEERVNAIQLQSVINTLAKRSKARAAAVGGSEVA